MKNITKNPSCMSMAGLKTIEFLSVDDGISIYFTSSTSCSVVTQATFTTVDAENITLNAKLNDAGAFETVVTCDVFGTSVAIDNHLFLMAFLRFVLIVTDNNNVRFVVGNTNTPLHFAYEHIADASPGGEHKYKFTFSADTELPPLKLDGIFDTLTV